MAPAVTGCKTFAQAPPGSASAPWCCSLRLTNSFEPRGDLEGYAEGRGQTKDAALEDACRKAVAQLMLQRPSPVVVLPLHWKISTPQLLAGMPGADPAGQALPVLVQARLRDAGAGATNLTEAQVDDRVAGLVHECLRAHGGWVDLRARVGR